MTNKLRQRIYNHARKNRHRLVWKRRLHALLYGAGLPILSEMKEKIHD